MAASRPANDGRRVEGTTLLGAEQISKSTSGRSPGLRLIASPMPSRRPNFLRKAVAKSSTGSPLTVAQPRRIRTAFPIKPGWVSWRPMSRFQVLIQRSGRRQQCSGAAARCQRAAWPHAYSLYATRHCERSVAISLPKEPPLRLRVCHVASLLAMTNWVRVRRRGARQGSPTDCSPGSGFPAPRQGQVIFGLC